MRLTSVKINNAEQAAIVTESGLLLLDHINMKCGTTWSTELFSLLQNEGLEQMKGWLKENENGKNELSQVEPIGMDEVEYVPLYRHPRKICGIGMNYWQKAEDLAAVPPHQEPICFLKPDTSLIGHGEHIVLPSLSQHVTAEAELGIVIGRVCKDVPQDLAMSMIAGFVPTLDMTAQDIHARNARFLGRSKMMDTFFSFGPQLVTIDECSDLDALFIETVLNGEAVHRNAVQNMIYNLPLIVSYFSSMMTLLPGDIIMTGTPGSVSIQAGDVAACRITGMVELSNPVKA